jgi:hypothetical protein
MRIRVRDILVHLGGHERPQDVVNRVYEPKNFLLVSPHFVFSGILIGTKAAFCTQ